MNVLLAQLRPAGTVGGEGKSTILVSESSTGSFLVAYLRSKLQLLSNVVVRASSTAMIIRWPSGESRVNDEKELCLGDARGATLEPKDTAAGR